MLHSSFRRAMPRTIAGGALLALAGGLVVAPTLAAPALAAPPHTPTVDGSTTEPQFWWNGFEGSVSDWQQSGASAWEFMDRDASNSVYGTDRRHTFTRASGTMAVAESKNAAFSGALTSAPIKVFKAGALELRFDSHYLKRGVETQSGTVTAIFDGRKRVEIHRFSGADEESAQPRVPFTVPNGTKTVQFEFAFESAAGGGSWRIDDVEVVRPLSDLAADAAPRAVVDVFSDVQGANAKLAGQVIPGLRAMSPSATTLLANGDLTGNGTDKQYADYFAALDPAKGDQYGTVVSTIGNHEFYGANGSENYIGRFLDRTGMRALGVDGANPAHAGLWGETLVDGELPLLWIGSEFHDYPAQTGNGPFVELSEEQFTWLSDRLAHWKAEGKPVVLASHHVFNDSVSGTYAKFYQGDFGADTERLEALLADYPNVTVLTSHTHWSPLLNDWSVEQRFDPTSNHGPTIVNTAAVTTQYGPSGDWNEKAVGGADPVGLRVELFDDRLRVSSYFFGADAQGREIKHVDVPLPAGQ